jgi:hypothetical protein
MLLTLPWHTDLTLTILNVYAPNAHNENEQFWDTLETKWSDMNLPFPDIMLGDFNIVEDAIDRLPSHKDPSHAVIALDSLRSTLQLKDGWRATYPAHRSFSFLQTGTGVQSRIDRICASNEIIETAADWEIGHSGIHTDHKLVSMCVIDPKTPFIGRGRWTMPMFLLEDKTLIKDIHDLGLKFERALNNIVERTTTSNPQVLFKSFKDDVIKLVRTKAKVAIPKMEQKIKKLQKEIQPMLANPDLEKDNMRRTLGLIEEQIANLERKRHKQTHTATAAHDRLEGETVSKYWSQVNKARKPRDVMYALEQPGSTPPVYETRSDKMSILARDYHHNLLSDGLVSPLAERTHAIAKVLTTVKDETKLKNEPKAKLAQ